MELKIDTEFHTLIPPLTDEERAELEASILREGCRDALVIWDGTIIDGHNRYEICQRHGLPFKTMEMEFANRDEAKEWIIRNQFGRRNLIPYVRGTLALKLEEFIKAKAKERQREHKGTAPGKTLPQKSAEVKPIETRQELARVAGVSHDTIKKVKVIEREATPEQKVRLESGQAKINTVYREIRPESSPQEDAIFKPLFISVRHIQMLTKQFLVEASGYIRMPDQIALLTAEEREQILKEAEPIENWCKEFRSILSC